MKELTGSHLSTHILTAQRMRTRREPSKRNILTVVLKPPSLVPVMGLRIRWERTLLSGHPLTTNGSGGGSGGWPLILCGVLVDAHPSHLSTHLTLPQQHSYPRRSQVSLYAGDRLR